MEYRPLPQNGEDIRLLVLLPGAGENAIECRIIHAKISQQPSYEALSYEWGVLEPAKSILVDGVETDITPNLWLALIHMRLRNDNRVLWVDALCINQRDTMERNHQVRLMDQIYSRAQIVVIWLGEVAPTHEGSVQTLFEWIDKCGEGEHSTVRFLDSYLPGSQNSNSDAILPYWKDLDSFFCSSSYWQRTWIVQEVILAPRITIQYGRWTTSWNGISFLEWGLSLYPNNRLLQKAEKSVPFKLQEHRRMRNLWVWMLLGESARDDQAFTMQ